MKRLYVIVEGQSEEEFVKTLISPYLIRYNIYSVTPILIHTSRYGRGGFVKYAHLKNDIVKLLNKPDPNIVVSMLVDFFRCPTLPHCERYEHIADSKQRIEEMEKCIAEDIDDRRFIPYIQLHEFEALLYSSNTGFEEYFSEDEAKVTKKIINEYPNPEDINSSPQKAPSKRLLAIKDDYDKVIEGNLIALSVGLNNMLVKCPRFKYWIESLIEACKEEKL